MQNQNRTEPKSNIVYAETRYYLHYAGKFAHKSIDFKRFSNNPSVRILLTTPCPGPTVLPFIISKKQHAFFLQISTFNYAFYHVLSSMFSSLCLLFTSNVKLRFVVQRLMV